MQVSVPPRCSRRRMPHSPEARPVGVRTSGVRAARAATEKGQRECQAHFHPFAGQVASFSRERVERAFRRYVWRPSPDAVTSVPVETIDWRTLTARYGPLDLVVIDAEGFDGEIISMNAEDPPAWRAPAK